LLSWLLLPGLFIQFEPFEDEVLWMNPSKFFLLIGLVFHLAQFQGHSLSPASKWNVNGLSQATSVISVVQAENTGSPFRMTPDRAADDTDEYARGS